MKELSPSQNASKFGRKNIRKGKEGERLAVEYLKKQGFKVVEQNFRTKLGEIDIIAKKADTLYFIEVKMRLSTQYGFPEEAVSSVKQRHLKAAAQLYIQKHKITKHYFAFAVIAILKKDTQEEIKWFALDL